jgi:hypothetical protein
MKITLNYNEYIVFTKEIWDKCQLTKKLVPEDITSIPPGYDESRNDYEIAINISKLENSELESCIIMIADKFELKYYQTSEGTTRYLILYKP